MQLVQLHSVIIASLFLFPDQWLGVESFVFRHGIASKHQRRCPSPTVSSTTSAITPTQLWMAGQRRSTNNKKSKPKSKKKNSYPKVTRNKKTKNKNDNKSKSKKSAGDAIENPMMTSTKSSTPKKKHVAPPWQAISNKDMKKNVEAEKDRRKLAQETGKHLSPLELKESQVSYQRSKSFLSPEDKALMAWKPFALNPNKQEVLFQGAFLNKRLPPRLGTPEVAFLGRSNVGKSSLLNRLVGKSDLARVGKTPGATASVNLYGIFEQAKKKAIGSNNNKQKALMGLVDLPGFGYAKLDKETKQSVQDTAENYLAKRRELALGVLLVDSRRTPTMDDKAVLAALYDMGLPLMVVATKVDKFSTQTQVDEALGVINRELGLPKGQPLCISAMTGTGIRDLWNIIMEACEGHVEELKNNAESGSAEEQKDFADDEPQYYDEEGDAEIAYSQGYDWIQGSVMYEADNGDYDYGYDDEDDGEDMGGFDDDYDDDYDDDDYSYGDESASGIPQKETLKSLKKRAREMEKRGEV